MNEDLPVYVPDPAADPESRFSAPVSPLAKATFWTSIPSLFVGGFLVVAVNVSRLRGEKDEWGVGPFFLGFGLALVTLAAVANGLATLGKRAEQTTAKRSIWSVVGLGLAIIAAVPSGLILLTIG